jgi:hypothetical protein
MKKEFPFLFISFRKQNESCDKTALEDSLKLVALIAIDEVPVRSLLLGLAGPKMCAPREGALEREPADPDLTS